jgi:hypothetical protein
MLILPRLATDAVLPRQAMDRLELQGAYTPAPCGRLTNCGTYTIVFCIRASNTVLLAGLRTNTFIGAEPNPVMPVMLVHTVQADDSHILRPRGATGMCETLSALMTGLPGTKTRICCAQALSENMTAIPRRFSEPKPGAAILTQVRTDLSVFNCLTKNDHCKAKTGSGQQFENSATAWPD